MKRPLIFFLLFLTLLTFSTPAKAYDFEDGGIYYNRISDTDVEVTSSGSSDNKYSGAVVIPSTVENEGTTYSVTSIGKFAFNGCSGLKSVTIGERVTSIGNYAFSGCSGLTSVTIPESVDTVGNYAFQNCSGLTSVTIPENVTSIGDAAFYNCSGLTSVEWNAINCPNFTSGNRPFDASLTSITFGNEVEHIPAYLCYNCSGLTSVTIPSSVTSIGVNAFYNCSGLKSVTIGERVTSIGNYAFSGCSGLTSVTIPESVDTVGNYAFNGCDKLTEVTIGERVTSIGNYAFNGCSGLMSVTIPNSVTSIGNGAFGGCSGLTSVTIPEGVTEIGKSTFQNCSGLTSVTIPNGVTSIGEDAFYNCRSLTSVTIPESVTSIGNYAFDGCSGLTSVEWNAVACQDFYDDSDDGDDVPFAPFEDCENITSITFGNQVERIPAYLCSGCSGLTSVTIPENVTSIRKKAFKDCSGLTSVEWNAINCPNFTSGNRPFYDCKKITAITFGDKVEHIPAYLCYDCSDLASVTIPNGVTSIGVSAFDGCSNLTSVTIPNSVTSIGNYAFDGCSGLTSVEWNAINCENFNQYSTIFPINLTAITFGDKVAHIPAYLCYGCSDLASVTIPENVTSIGNAAFYNCSGLTSVEWNAINCENCAPYSTTFPINLTAITFGDKVAHIPAYLCSGCRGLTSVTIPENVTSIGKGALGGIGLRSVEWNAINCKDFTQSSIAFSNFLTSITFGDKVEHIPAYLCYEWSGLTSVTIPENVTSIGGYAFSDCIGLTSVTIPENVISVKKCAFSGCTGLGSVEWNAINCENFDQYSTTFPSNLTAITFGDKVEHIPAYLCYEWSGLKSVTIPNSVTSIGEYAFSGCGGLTSVVIPNGVTTIDYGTFGRCSGLTSVTIPEGVTSIGRSAFYGCSSLTSVTIPASVTAIGDWAFVDCTGLTSVTSLSTTPPDCPNNDVFSPYDTLYVPCGCKTAYEGAVGWSVFKKIIEQECNYITVTLLADDKMGAVTGGGEYAYGTEAAIEAVPNPGYRFVSWSDGNTDNPRTLTVTEDITLTAEFASETPTPTTTKTDTLYFEFALEEGETSATIEYSFSNTVLPGIEMEYYDGQAHDKFSPNATGNITVNGNGHGWIYYTYEESAGYSVLCSSQGSGLNNDIWIHTLSGVNLTALDVSGCTALEALWCNYNQLTSLDVSSNTALTSLACHNNKLTGLNVNGCTALTYLDCNYNKLTSLDVSGCTALTTLWCENNQLTVLDIGTNTFLAYLNCEDNHLPLSILYGTYTQMGNGSSFYANNQIDTIAVGMCHALDLSTESPLGGIETSYELKDEAGNEVSAEAYTENDFAFQFHNPATYTLKLQNTSVPNASMTYHITAEECFTVSVSVNNGAWGWATQTGNGTYGKGKEVTIIATPAEGYRFVNWTKPDGEEISIYAVYTFAVTEDLVLVANFEEIPDEPLPPVEEGFRVILSVNNPAWGLVFKTGNCTYGEGEEITILALPFAGYRFVNWTKEDGSVFSTDSLLTFKVTENLELTANFEEIPVVPVVDTFTVNVSSSNEAWGSVLQSGNGRYEKDSSVSITATPNQGYRFINWTKGGEVFGTASDTTFKVTEDLELVANFEKISDEKPVGDDFHIYVKDNVIYLSENRGKVQVFNVIGQCLYTGNTTAIRVRQTGVYIISVGGQNYKVLVM